MGKKENIKNEQNKIIYFLALPFKQIYKLVLDTIYNIQVAIHEKALKNNKVKAAGMGQKRRKELTFYYCIVALPLLQFLIFYVGVNINSILLAFKSYKINEMGIGAYSYTGFSNFSIFINDIFNNVMLKSMMNNSFLIYGIGLVVGIPLSILFSYYLYKKFLFSKTFNILLFFPSIISSVVMVLMYQYFIDRAIPGMMFNIFGIKIDPPLSITSMVFPLVVFFNLWSGFGVSVLMYSSAMSRIPESIVECAKIEGISKIKELWYITLPLIYPTITTFLVAGTAGIASIFTNQSNLYTFFGEAADSKLYTFGYYLFVKVIGTKATLADYPYAAAAGLIFTAIVAPVTIAVRWALEKFGPVTEY